MCDLSMTFIQMFFLLQVISTQTYIFFFKWLLPYMPVILSLHIHICLNMGDATTGFYFEILC